MSVRTAIIDSPESTLNRVIRLLKQVAGFQLAWEAPDYRQAMRKMEKETPDLFLIGLSLPDRATQEVIKEIKAVVASPVLVIDTAVGGKHQKVFRCMGAGAVDVVSITPNMSDAEALEALSKKLMIMSKLLGVTKGATLAIRPTRKKETLIAIGSSTGGPAALSAILSNIPTDLPAGIVVVQHLDQQFSRGFIQWLDNHSVLPVHSAAVGDKPKIGTVSVAAQDDHLVMMSGGCFQYTPEPKDNPYRPSVDAFFASVAQHWTGHAIGVLLTGMGKDGGQGLLAMRNSSFHTIAEDKSTCVVYGMPKAAVDLQAAMAVLPLHKIASAIVDWSNNL